MTQDEVLKQALEALELALRSHGVMLLSDPPQDAWKTYGVDGNARQAITSLRQAIAGLESQEPVVGTKTWFEDGKVINQNLTASKIYKKPDEEEYLSKAYRLSNELRCHLAIAPAPQRTWVGLTDEEAQWLYDNCRTPSNLIDMVEAKLKEKNT